MKRRFWGIAALAACLITTNATSLRADGDVQPDEMAELDALVEEDEFDSYNSYQSGATCTIGGGHCGGGGGFMDRPMQLVFGAEYIYAQATFSEALAFVEQDAVAGGETFHQIDFDYEASYSVYGGLYLPDCGGAVIFDYTRLNSSGDYAATETANNQIFGPFEMDDNIVGNADVELNSYDLGFSKTIPLGCLQTCGTECGDCCEDSCCDSGCGWCPAWDITWSGGVRYADVGWSNSITQINTGPINDNATTTLDFDGYGGRVGLMGRRYLGKRGLFSLYAKGDWSILFGEVDLQTLVSDVNGTAFLRTNNDVTVPVTELELGGTAHLGAHASLSAGYFLSAWHDLGMSPTYDFNSRFQISHFDDANILGWNGFFARAEVAF